MLAAGRARTMLARWVAAPNGGVPPSCRAASAVSVRDAFVGAAPAGEVTLRGWVRTARLQKRVNFVEINDGSYGRNLQVVWSEPEVVATGSSPADITVGAAVEVHGRLVPSPKPMQPVEVHAHRVAVVGGCDAGSYPLQKKAHTAEFLRDMAHLRCRTPTQSAMLRIRHALFTALHATFNDLHFFHVATPILTANDCEGAGELFTVTPRPTGQAPAPAPPFFGKPVYLTVSGQLHLEAFAAGLGNVYSFGPTFRAENSNTARHLCEFWMVEPEMSHATADDAMDVAERCIRDALKRVLSDHAPDIGVMSSHAPGLEGSLAGMVTAPTWHRMTYTQAVQILADSGVKFHFPVRWGDGLASEHERYLAEVVVGGPVFVHDYPAALKPFYMKQHGQGDPTHRTAAAFDLLVPGIGELVGGSGREDDFDVLAHRMHDLGLLSPTYAHSLGLPLASPSSTPPVPSGREVTALRRSAPPADCAMPYLDWYLDLRRYGGVPHAGWGMGFERLVMLATGLDNIRDCIPVPRVPASCRM